MPGAILTEMTLFSCPHQMGQFQLIAKARHVMIQGSPVLTTADIPGKPTVPCTAPPPPAPTAPCVALVAVTPGSTTVKVLGNPVLTATTTGATSGNPPGPALPKPVQQTVKTLS